jgi:hypothetical protein
MPDRTVRIMERGRLVCRGLAYGNAYEASLAIDENDNAKVTLDWTAWLDGDTIASVSNTVTGGVSLTAETTSSPTHTFKVSGSSPGLIEHRMTTTTSAETKELRILVAVGGAQLHDDYGHC